MSTQAGSRATSAGWGLKDGKEVHLAQRAIRMQQDSIDPEWQPPERQEDAIVWQVMPAAIKALEDSPIPLAQRLLVRTCGYGGDSPSNCYSSLLQAMTHHDHRVYEEDDGAIGLVGVHILADGTYPNGEYKLYTYRSRANDTINQAT